MFVQNLKLEVYFYLCINLKVFSEKLLKILEFQVKIDERALKDIFVTIILSICNDFRDRD